jgi:shikimate dehydrogenase
MARDGVGAGGGRFAAVAALAGNPLGYPDGRSFAAILGESPSRGARSPTLWNAAFAAQGVDARMLPIDVTSERLISMLDALDANAHFIGGAVTVPHKEVVARWLGDRVTPEARAIGAVNCLFRGRDGRLHGTNTDGEGSIRSFEAQFGAVRGNRVLLLGPGGAGKAVAAFFQHAGCELMIASRSDEATAVAERLHARATTAAAELLRARALAWDAIDDVLSACDVLINCTSVGAGKQIGMSPLTAEQLGKLPPTAAVFDIIYQPSPTALLALAQARGLQTLDGSGMNLEQAVIAYGYASPAPRGVSTTRVAMVEARNQLGS